MATRGELGARHLVEDRHRIIDEGAPASHAYYLESGGIEICHEDPDGRGVVVKMLVGPTMFGTIECVAREPVFLESARAFGPAAFFSMTQSRFLDIIRGSGEAAYETLVDTSTAFCVAARFEHSRLYETDILLANLLCTYAAVAGRIEDNRVRIMVPRTQPDLAEAIGAGERSVNRVLAHWKAEKWVEKVDGCYVLLRPDTLREIASPLLGSLIHQFVEHPALT